ncbi:unnamed protein product [Cercopithifilaria johnstoni]|uniref:Uncharacterized protein n=1 Tax=Cercopithifilaria johnstoni TaxID=2874296 RepID=A0A8J2LPU8_9BILA|nr:unnamed protein product [Cercopithifilaria johnstoni]
MNHETAMGSRYCAIERRGEFNYSNNFDERDNLQTRNAGNRNNGYWGNRNNNGYWGNRNNNGYWGNRNNGDWGNRNNGYWGGRRGERNGAFRGRRPGKYSHINAGGSNEARGYYSFDDAENHNVNKENKRGESAAYAGSSEWDLPPPRNQHANRFTRFNKNTH